MKKVTFFLVVTLVTGLFVSTFPSSLAQTGTPVNGIITQDTTWTKENSPYNLTGNIAVEEEVTLTVESGVTVNLNGYYIRVNGTIIAKGNGSDRIQFNEGRIEFSESSSAWNEQLGSGSLISNSIVNSKLSMGGASPMINSNTITDSISVGSGSPIISKNGIIGATGSDQLGRPVYCSFGIYLTGNNMAFIADNTISGEFYEAAIKIEGGEPIIERNLISNRYGYGGYSGYGQAGISISGNSSPTIKQNTITKNANGISVGGSPIPTIVNNNIEDNTNYNLYMGSRAVNIDAANNWWGTTNQQSLNQTIYDFTDDFNLGEVNFIPFLNNPSPQAMPDLNAPVLTPASSSLTPNSSPSQTPTQPHDKLSQINIALLIVIGIVAALLILVIALKQRRSLKGNAQSLTEKNLAFYNSSFS